MPYIVVRRSDIPAGAVQITDLYFNKSNARVHNGPVPQGPIYLKPIEINGNGRLCPRLKTTGGDIIITNKTSGLVAYVLTQIANNGAALTYAEALDAADYIVAKAYAAQDFDNLENDLQNDINGDYTYSDEIENLIKILSGEKFVVNAGTPIQDAGNHTPLLITTSNFPIPGDRRLVTGDTAWVESLATGQLYKYTNTINSYLSDLSVNLGEVNLSGVTPVANGNGNPYAVVYLNNGTVITSADL
jgi:hypothetical protein